LLRVYHHNGQAYSQVNAGWLSEVGLGVRLWRGVYEGLIETWLRWHDQAGSVIPTGAEGAKRERQRAERLAAQLRALGVEPQDT